MRKISLTAALAAATLSTAAIAADWVLVSSSMSATIYIDRDSIRTMPSGYKRAWVRSVLAEPNKWGDTSYMTLDEFDCREGRNRTLQSLWRKGEEVTDTSNNISEWIYVPPGSVIETQLNYVCFGKLLY